MLTTAVETTVNEGNGNKYDPIDASADALADALVDAPPTHDQRVGRHTTNASADTRPTRRPTHYQRVGRQGRY